VSRRGVLLLAALTLASLVLVTRREAVPPVPAPSGRVSPPVPSAAAGVDLAVDPASIRDVFRFVERPSAAAVPVEGAAAPAVAAEAPDPFRLVGLVRRQGRLLAAFAVDGDVVLAGPGDRAGALTVLEVGEEGVRFRRPDGSEGRIALP